MDYVPLSTITHALIAVAVVIAVSVIFLAALTWWHNRKTRIANEKAQKLWDEDPLTHR